MRAFLDHAKKIEHLLETKKKLVVYHRDTDGTTSAALLLKFFPCEVMALENPQLDRVTIYKIKQKKPELIVFLDLAIDQDWKEITELEEVARILIIDHHLFDKDLSSKQTLFINPRRERKEAYLAAAYLVYHLLKKMGKAVAPYAWISAMGVIGDYAFAEGRDVLEETKKSSPSLIDMQKPRESLVAEGGKMISAAITVAGDKGAEKALTSLLKAETFEEFAADKKLREWNERVQKEINHILSAFEKEREYYPEIHLSILTVTSKLPVTAAISTLLAERYPEMILAIKRKDEDGVKVSLRNQSGRMDLNAVARKAAEGIGRGGGHEKAAGALVTDWEAFKTRLISAIRKMEK